MTESPVLRHLLIATILALTPLTAAADIVGSINKVRAQGCPGRRGGEAPLRENRQLDSASHAELARGADLRRAEKQANYQCGRIRIRADLLSSRQR